MRLATWNVNSIRARIELVVAWAERVAPDVLLLQETKVATDQFPTDSLVSLGYRVTHWGTGAWNGVAVLTREAPREVRYGTGFARAPLATEEPRALAVRLEAGWFVSVYVPNGRALDDPHYVYKLTWLAELRAHLADLVADGVVVGGDFNVAPSDHDVWDPSALEGATHVSLPERRALDALLGLGLTDVYRALHPDDPGFTWWDYRQGAFRRGMGMRIDLVLASEDIARNVVAVDVDIEARRAPRPSDHAPLVVDLA